MARNYYLKIITADLNISARLARVKVTLWRPGSSENAVVRFRLLGGAARAGPRLIIHESHSLRQSATGGHALQRVLVVEASEKEEFNDFSLFFTLS